MALFKGSLFAGALFAGSLLVSGATTPDPTVAEANGRPWRKAVVEKQKKRTPAPKSVQLSEIARDTNAERIIRLQNDDEEVLLLITQAVGVLYG